MAVLKTYLSNQIIQYDEWLFPDPDNISFDPIVLEKLNVITGTATGRGMAYYLLISGVEVVLRKYRRGGLISKLMKNKYIWRGLAATRPWKEWNLLLEMQRLGLPVPKPVACRVGKIKFVFTLFYDADIIMTRIEKADSLSSHLINRELDNSIWENIGRTIRRFHDNGINHADLNAHNIMINENNKVFLIDFDKGKLMPPVLAWQKANIARLKRSLLKLNQIETSFHYSNNNWLALLNGYQAIEN